MAGPVDIDRMQYVKGDIEYADGVFYDANALAKGLLLDGHTTGETLIDQSAIERLIDFLVQRARLYVEVYYDPIKLAMERIVSSFLTTLWSLQDKAEQWQDVWKPNTIEDFLSWTDAKVIGALDGERWNEAPDNLTRLRNLIRNGGFQVAEIRQRGISIVDVDVIEMLLDKIRHVLIQREFSWILDGEALTLPQALEKGSVFVKSKGRYHDLFETAEFRANQELAAKLRRCPLAIFPTTDFSEVQKLIDEAGLVLSNVMPVGAIQRFLLSSVVCEA